MLSFLPLHHINLFGCQAGLAGILIYCQSTIEHIIDRASKEGTVPPSAKKKC